MLYKIKIDNGCGFINELGVVVVKPLYELVFDYKYDCCVVRKELRFGLIDNQGNELLSCNYDYIQQVAKGIVVVSSKEGKALMDLTGKMLTEPLYGGIFDFSEGLAMAYKGLKFGYLNLKGEEAISFEFDFAEKFKEGYAMVLKENKYSLINQKGEFEKEWKFDFYSQHENGYIVNIGGKRVDDDCIGGKYGLLSNENKLLTAIEFDFIDRFYDRHAVVQKAKQYGELDENGIITIPISHTTPQYRKEAYSSYEELGKFGLENSKGEKIIQALYEELHVYPEYNLCWVKQNNLFGILTFENCFILKPSLDLSTIYSMNQEYVHVELKNHKHGLLSTMDGSWLLPPEYDSIGIFKGSLVELERDGKQFYANRKGEVVWSE